MKLGGIFANAASLLCWMLKVDQFALASRWQRLGLYEDPSMYLEEDSHRIAVVGGTGHTAAAVGIHHTAAADRLLLDSLALAAGRTPVGFDRRSSWLAESLRETPGIRPYPGFSSPAGRTYYSIRNPASLIPSLSRAQRPYPSASR